ncbi:MAG: GerMN domain-containing protein, partial [Chloroflexi bacterium]|nr:GerMN domain-containing protein [Chloroflexota bacterium]
PAPATQAPPSAPRGRPIAFFAASGKEPAAVTIDWNAAMAGSYPSEHVYYRLRTLRELSAAAGPGGGYVNVFRSIAPQSYSVRTDAEAAPGAVFLDFTVTSSGWGVSADQVKLLLQQLVYTATEEPDIDHVRITQNGGRPAVIAGATVASDLTREGVR